jgi:hypothetical protein
VHTRHLILHEVDKVVATLRCFAINSRRLVNVRNVCTKCRRIRQVLEEFCAVFNVEAEGAPHDEIPPLAPGDAKLLRRLS